MCESESALGKHTLKDVKGRTAYGSLKTATTSKYRKREKQMRSIKKNQKKATNIHGIYGTNVYIYRNQVNRKRQS